MLLDFHDSDISLRQSVLNSDCATADCYAAVLAASISDTGVVIEHRARSAKSRAAIQKTRGLETKLDTLFMLWSGYRKTCDDPEHEVVQAATASDRG